MLKGRWPTTLMFGKSTQGRFQYTITLQLGSVGFMTKHYDTWYNKKIQDKWVKVYINILILILSNIVIS